MVLVFIFVFLVILVISILISTLRINIERLELSNEIPNTPIIKKLELSIGLYMFGKIKIFKKNINKEDIKKIQNSKRMEKIKNKILKQSKENNKKQNVKMDIGIIKYLKPKLQKIDLELKLGTEDVILTSFLIVIISIAISIGLSQIIDKYDESKYKYKIIPNYNNKNSVKIFLKSIIDIKLVNIINILFRLLFRSDEFDKRASNRRTYDNSNEQYPRNDRCKYNYRGTYWNK